MHRCIYIYRGGPYRFERLGLGVTIHSSGSSSSGGNDCGGGGGISSIVV